MMIEFKRIKTTVLFPDKIYIEWAVTNPALNSDYFYNIYMRDSSEFPDFKKVNVAPLLNQYHYIISKLTLNKFPNIEFYIEGQTSQYKFKSRTFNLLYGLDKRQYLIAVEIARKNELTRKIHNGVECSIYKRMTTGVPCDCKDKVTGLVIKSNCSKCYGTGYIGGYIGPLGPVWVEIYHNGYQLQPTEVGNIDQIVGQARISRPLVEIGDILLEHTRNYRWYIKSIQYITYRTFPVDQIVEIRMISPKDIEYNLKGIIGYGVFERNRKK